MPMSAMAVEVDGYTVSRSGGIVIISVLRPSSLPNFSSPKLVYCSSIQNPDTLREEFKLNVSTKIPMGNANYDQRRGLGLIAVNPRQDSQSILDQRVLQLRMGMGEDEQRGLSFGAGSFNLVESDRRRLILVRHLIGNKRVQCDGQSGHRWTRK
ncbi:hypothetical protein NE237_002287 [Protea cynaroides]|uniref:Uncharacterized protein n=1 Tax=Protea cynaroides TaxID=273540 RepID=A0A9Q0KVT3_9MAGN|nr:hypothetical protein NE237_002287 [Protea cynaroides]